MDPFTLLSMLGSLGQVGGGLAGLFGGKKFNGTNPSDVANQYLNQIPGAMKPYYQPYMDAGGKALQNLQGEYGTLTDNPQDIYEKLSKNYEPSKGYKFSLEQALNAAGNASAAGGMAGTPQDQQQQMKIGQGLASQDFQQYLDRMLGLYGTGLQGQQGLETQGFNANTDYGNMLGSLLGQQAQYGYAGQDWKNQNRRQNLNNIFSGLSSMGSGYQTGNYLNNLFNQG